MEEARGKMEESSEWILKGQSNDMCSPTISKGTCDNPDFELAKLFNVKGKAAVVAGRGSGMGLIATQALVVNGAKVYIVGRTEEKLETVARTYGQDTAGEIILITADFSKKEDIRRLVSGPLISREVSLYPDQQQRALP